MIEEALVDRRSRRALQGAGLEAVLGLLAAAPPAWGFGLRAPQVVFDAGPALSILQAGGMNVDPRTGQLDAPTWSSDWLGIQQLTLQVVAHPPGGVIGVYDALAASPPLIPVLAPDAAPGSYSVLDFANGSLAVVRFDASSQFLGAAQYPGVSGKAFGFYYQGANGTFFSEDARNGGKPQALTFGESPGCPPSCVLDTWYEGFEGASYTPAGTFTSAIVLLQSAEVLPARPATWGSIKGHYR